MGFLTDYEDPKVEFKGKSYAVDLAYDTVLNIFRMYRERLLLEADLLVEALLLFGLPERAVGAFTWQERAELLEQIYQEHINFRPRPGAGREKRLFDFEEDGAYIYASFRQAYGIDLIEEQGRLPWRRFLALFQGLPEKTKIREIMRIRDMDIPQYNGKNYQEIQKLLDLKAYYALEHRDEEGQDNLDGLFATLKRMAAKG